jgi:nucleoside-diphosphate-sugar epimerase
VYNVVDDEPLRRREFFDTLAAALGVAPPRFPPAWLSRITGPIGETLARSQRISNVKLTSHSDWRPRTPSVRQGWPALVERLGERQPLATVGVS